MKENSDGSDTNVGSIGNSIEEDIKIVEKLINTMKSDRELFNEKTDKEIYTFFINALEHILSDYKRVLKENEILKEEKEQAWEEWNNLEQGSYETEQKLKQQIKESQKENEELNYKLHSKKIALEIYNRYIPKSKLKDIIDRIDYDIKKTKEIISKNTNIYASYRKNDYQIIRLRAMNTKSLDIKKRLQELLESEE